ncbi:thiopeptide-type bacteriocin biosynthesis protein [Gelidibacter sp. F2691]|nr:thiopeptide-type bacteriocin biosynthesis protein [Gelidibacter sp. F2691]
MIKKNKRYFTIGSEWLYYKLYMGSETCETFLISTLSPIVNRLLDDNIIDKWFFINYNDPHKHIRVRFHLVDERRNIGIVIQILNDAFSYYLEQKLINDIQVGLYKRELERYGDHSICSFETLFFLNSRLVLGILKHVHDEPNNRWLWCLKSIDCFMSDWNFSLIEKRNFFQSLTISFGEEMGVTSSINKQLSMKYRLNRGSIENIIEKNIDILDDLLSEHRKESRTFINHIIEQHQSDISKPNPEVLESYIHMHCNRVFNSRQRMNEWVVYYFLHQYYRSQVAQGKT